MGRPAARVGDPHICPMFDGLKPHVGGPVLPPGKPTVMIGGMPAATVSDRCLCASAPDVIIQGSASVVINGLPAARMGDATMHGGRIILGCPTVLIGDFGMVTPDMITNMIDFRTERPGITQDTSRPYVLAGAGGGGAAQISSALAAAKDGTPFMEKC
ncbi:PAAR domain-containing protein [Dyadobacter jiangsuensis]|uniref:Putative Zn-binding protein involved in type VI secretion n=1 Tax=Dyadobacter jiangsuensis TaxID=1591085 RepID=A0A2P8G0E9_9BACT|nr:PAAR domain-containing protein [Dyadobacter jiangsuensis]PSL27434.1 putative Zn-binding protein involved in type VI secretion [Dyadobacter jiangsuensis]